MGAQIHAVEWVRVTVTAASDASVEGIELHYAGFSGALLKVLQAKYSIYTMLVIKSTREAEREYSVNPSNIYDKLMGLRSVESLYMLSYCVEQSYRVSDE